VLLYELPVPPPPAVEDQLRLVGFPVLASIHVTNKGEHPDFTDIEKLATG